MPVVQVTREINSAGELVNSVGVVSGTAVITGVVLRKSIPQGISRTPVVDNQEITNNIQTLTLSQPGEYGPANLRVFIDNHEVAQGAAPAGGYTISNNVITPASIGHTRTYPQNHSNGAFIRRIGVNVNQTFLIDDGLPSEITTVQNGTLEVLRITNTRGIPGPTTLPQPIISTWTANLATAGGGSGDGFFEDATSVAVGTMVVNGVTRDGFIITYTDGPTASERFSSRLFPPNSNSLVEAEYESNGTAPDEVVRAEYDVLGDVGSIRVRPTNVTATITIPQASPLTGSDTVILLKNGPKGGFTQEITPGSHASGELTVNDVISAIVTT